MNIRKNKLLKIILLLTTIILFVIYFMRNRDSFERIGDLSPIQFILIIIGQLTIFFANILIVMLIGKLDNKKIQTSVAARITAYSSLINFFGFLQGGVGFRGIYLKKYYAISYKKYFILTSIQYLVLFSCAAFLVLFGVSLTKGLVYTVTRTLLIGGVLVVLFLLLKHFGILDKLSSRFSSLKTVHSKKVLYFIPIILLQLSGSALAYGVELHAIGASLTLGGLLIFTGMSQFAIVIALTPGAIGIREALLLVAQKQMLLSTGDIIVASTIDRMVYFVTLAIITPLAIGMRNEAMSLKDESQDKS